MACLKTSVLLGLLCAALAFGQQTTDDPKPVPVRVDVDLVLLNASVSETGGRYLTGLKQQDFHIWEDKVEQQIEYFNAETVPLSVGIIFDVSGSMEDKLPAARAAASIFLRGGEREDEYLLIQFSDSAQLVQDFTTDITKLQSRLLFTKAKGSTALYDALYLGMEKVNHGSNPRKALLLITDGMDNHSRYSLRDVRDFAREHDVMIYCIGIEDPSDVQVFGSEGRRILENFAELTGGDAYFPATMNDLPGICARIAVDLKTQYVIGYRSHNLSQDGKWRKLKVKVSRSKGQSSVSVRAKSGYFASNAARAMK